MRQRLLAESALAATNGDSQPIVANLPAGWDPGTDWRQAHFFAALRQPWLALTAAPSGITAPRWTGTPAYPASARRAEIGIDGVTAARSLQRVGDDYSDALVTPGDTAEVFSRIALESVSLQARQNPHVAATQVRSVSGGLLARLAGIRIVSSPFVTLSGSSGTFVVTLVNALDVPVHVGIRATATGHMVVTGPMDLRLPAGQRTTVKIRTSAPRIGVQNVTLTPVTAAGAAVGTPTQLRVRVSEVSGLIWAVMGAGGLVLLVMIVRRALKRGLRPRAEGADG